MKGTTLLNQHQPSKYPPPPPATGTLSPDQIALSELKNDYDKIGLFQKKIVPPMLRRSFLEGQPPGFLPKF